MSKFLLLFFVFFANHILAQSPFTPYFSDQKLRNGYINAIVQDENGFIGVGTEAGYDKLLHNFVNYSRNQGLANETVTAAYKSKMGTLWLGTSSGILYKYDRNTDKFVWQKFTKPLNQRITQIFEDKQSNLWLVCKQGILVRISDKVPTIFRFENNQINDCLLYNNQLLVALNNHLCLATVSKNRLKYVSIAGLNDHFTSLEPKKNGRGWYAGTKENGVFDFENEFSYQKITTNNGLASNQITDIKQLQYRTVNQTTKTELWVATNLSLHKIEPETGSYQTVSDYASSQFFGSGKPNILFCDQQNNLWIGTYGNGLYLFEGDVMQPKNTALKNIKHLLALPNGYLAATDLSLDFVDKDFAKTTKIPFFENKNISSLTQDTANNCIWVGTTTNGLFAINSLNFGLISDIEAIQLLPSQHINDLKTDTKGGLWIATSSEGLFYAHPKRRAFYKISVANGLASNTISEISLQPNNDLYAVVKGQGIVLIRNNEQSQGAKITPIANTDTLDVLQMTGYKNSLIVCTANAGVISLKNNQPTPFFEDNKYIGSKNINGVFFNEKSNKLWFVAKKGLIKYDPTQNPVCNYYKINTQAELTARSICFAVPDDNTLFLGCETGVWQYKPQNDGAVMRQPKTSITSILVNDKSVGDLGAPFSITNGSNTVLITCFLFNYRLQSRNIYEFTLKNEDHEWRTKGKESTVKYNNLPSGNYIFTAKGIGENGFLEGSTCSIRFVINSPFYRQWYFFPICLLILFFLTISTYFVSEKINVSKLQIATQNLSEQVATLEKELNERENATEILENQNKELVQKTMKLDIINQQLSSNINKRTEEANEASQDFANYVYRTSHDLNGPIARIEGLVNLYKTLQNTAYLTDNIDIPVKDLRQRFDTLHDIVKIQEYTPKIESINLDELINAKIKQFDSDDNLIKIWDRNKNPQIIINNKIKGNIKTDQYILNIVLEELLKNIMQHFAAKTRLIIQILATETETEWHIEVIDNGIKIPQEVQTHMFTMFYKKGTLGGLGVGLTKARNCMRRADGNLLFDPKPSDLGLNTFCVIVKKPIVRFGV